MIFNKNDTTKAKTYKRKHFQRGRRTSVVASRCLVKVQGESRGKVPWCLKSKCCVSGELQKKATHAGLHRAKVRRTLGLQPKTTLKELKRKNRFIMCVKHLLNSETWNLNNRKITTRRCRMNARRVKRVFCQSSNIAKTRKVG